MSVRWDLDFTDNVEARARAGAGTGVAMALELILGQARQDVPIEEGTLERSGATTQDGLTGTISFDTPYAVIQHEDLTMRHDNGRSPKYLERAMSSERDAALRVIRTQIERAIGGA